MDIEYHRIAFSREDKNRYTLSLIADEHVVMHFGLSHGDNANLGYFFGHHNDDDNKVLPCQQKYIDHARKHILRRNSSAGDDSDDEFYMVGVRRPADSRSTELYRACLRNSAQFGSILRTHEFVNLYMLSLQNGGHEEYIERYFLVRPPPAARSKKDKKSDDGGLCAASPNINSEPSCEHLLLHKYLTNIFFQDDSDFATELLEQYNVEQTIRPGKSYWYLRETRQQQQQTTLPHSRCYSISFVVWSADIRDYIMHSNRVLFVRHSGWYICVKKRDLVAAAQSDIFSSFLHREPDFLFFCDMLRYFISKHESVIGVDNLVMKKQQ